MPIKNESTLVDRFQGTQKHGRAILVEMINEALSSVEPKRLIHSVIKLNTQKKIITIHNQRIPFTDRTKICVVGGGKASGDMAEAVENIFGDLIVDGVVIVPEKLMPKYRNQTKNINILPGNHPLPTKKGAKNVKKMLSLIDSQEKDTLVICLISGGGSALLPAPAENITLEDLSKVNQLLLASGATIHEFNVVRKHLSVLKGGHLAARINPRPWVSLIISDVVGDNLETIASGPTVPDPSTFHHMKTILDRYSLIDQIPKSVQKRLELGLQKLIPETIKDPKVFKNGDNFIIGNIKVACNAALSIATKYQIPGKIISTTLTGEARDVGVQLGSELNQIAQEVKKKKQPYVLIYGGETTVTLKGKGRGGRNQELVVASTQELCNPNTFLASIATDGVDGTDPVAGGIADWCSCSRISEMGLKTSDFLDNNDSYTLLDKLKDLIITGPTGTNVMDMQILLAL